MHHWEQFRFSVLAKDTMVDYDEPPTFQLLDNQLLSHN